MKTPTYLTNNQLEAGSLFETVSHLEQEILRTAHQTTTLSEVLLKAYAMLTDEQKIAFILAGGMPSLFQHQHRDIDADRETGQLPILC